MNKVLVYSDIHIHAHRKSLDRLNDCLKCLEWIFDTARKNNISNIIFAGDLYQERQNISVLTYQKTFEVFEKNADIKTYLLMGNHDMYLNECHSTSSIIPLRALPNVQIIAEPGMINIQGKDIDFLPYTKNPPAEIEKHFKKKSDILFGHLSVDSAILNSYYKTLSEISVEHDGETIKVDVGIFEGWKKVLLGHFHGAQKLNDTVEYIGSPLQLNFNEVFQEKHIIILDLDTLEQAYIINHFSPVHLIIKENEIENYTLENNFVQIISDDLNSSKIIDVKKSVEKKAATLEFKEAKNNKKNELKTDIDNAKKILSDGEIIEKYTSLMETKLDRAKLIRIGHDIMQKASAS